MKLLMDYSRLQSVKRWDNHYDSPSIGFSYPHLGIFSYFGKGFFYSILKKYSYQLLSDWLRDANANVDAIANR